MQLPIMRSTRRMRFWFDRLAAIPLGIVLRFDSIVQTCIGLSQLVTGRRKIRLHLGKSLLRDA